MALKFNTLDVFTQKRFAGNPLAVVRGGDDLSGEVMQIAAREFNLSETVFVLKPENPAHTAKLRIFTPFSELPFAGHPTIGTAILLAEQIHGTVEKREAIIVLEEGIGLVRVGVVIKPGSPTYAEFDAPPVSECDGPVSREAVAGTLGLMASDIGFDNHRLSSFSAGLPFVFVPVRDIETLGRAKLMAMLWDDIGFKGENLDSAYLYTRSENSDEPGFRSRMLSQSMPGGEDPATGSAVAAFAGVMEKFGGLSDGRHELIVNQGVEMGRPSIIRLGVELTGGKLTATRIGGHAVGVLSGALEV
ncbi:MAG: PhzF family phenazine biosynthesis protein [Alphaproteobacteria bacterium]